MERDLNDEENGGAGDETEEGEVSQPLRSTDRAEIMNDPQSIPLSQGGGGSSEDNLSHESYELIEKAVVSGTPQPAVAQV